MRTFKLYQIIALVSIIILCGNANVMAQISSADSVAQNRSIFIQKETEEVTIYDYGQTEMRLRFFNYVTPLGNMYFSNLYLKTPDDETDVYLSLNESRLFLKRLYGIYQIDQVKDGGVWKERKRYFFSMKVGSSEIYFQLYAAENGNPEESTAVGGINHVEFTINDFHKNRERIRRALESLVRVVSNKKNDISANLLQDQMGLSGYKIDYQKFYDNNIDVLDSDIHNTEDLKIITEHRIGRNQRRIPVGEFNNDFNNYSIVYDEELNFYALEEVSISSFTDEIISIVKDYEGTGILNFEIFKEGDTIFTTFSIVQGRYEGNRSSLKGS